MPTTYDIKDGLGVDQSFAAYGADNNTALNSILTKLNGSLAVTGTFFQATQPVSGTVTANAGTGTFAISAASLPLPTGAATSAKQAALGTAGTASTDVLTVQGIASMVALKVDGSAVTQPISGSLTNISGTISLPTGAATSANQATANGYLSTIATAAASTAPMPIYLGTDAISNNGTSLTPKFAKVSASTSGASTVIAAVASKKLRVLQFWLTGNGAVNANLQSHTTTATATGLVYIAAAGGGISAPFSPVGLFETVAGEALDINLSGAVAVGGGVVYVEV
jgi:hypothetical protein